MLLAPLSFVSAAENFLVQGDDVLGYPTPSGEVIKEGLVSWLNNVKVILVPVHLLLDLTFSLCQILLPSSLLPRGL
jgi:hypothetical protein